MQFLIIKISMVIFAVRKNNPQIYLKPQKTPTSQRNPEKKEGGITLHDS